MMIIRCKLFKIFVVSGLILVVGGFVVLVLLMGVKIKLGYVSL